MGHPEKKEGFYVLKCNLHTHFFESYGNDAKIMVDAYRDDGYDCIALTEHDYYLKDLEVEKAARAYAEKKYGQEFIVIIGEEIYFELGKNDRKYRKEMTALFLDKYISCGRQSPDDDDPPDLISAGKAFEKIHAQGGIAIIAHDSLTVWRGEFYDGKGKQIWAWDLRKDLPIDGWEIGNGIAHYGANIANAPDRMLSHPRESVNEGYISVANSDAHNAKDIKPYGICHTYLFVTERTTNGIKEALLEKRTVADCNGELFGEQRWLNLLRQKSEG